MGQLVCAVVLMNAPWVILPCLFAATLLLFLANCDTQVPWFGFADPDWLLDTLEVVVAVLVAVLVVESSELLSSELVAVLVVVVVAAVDVSADSSLLAAAPL